MLTTSIHQVIGMTTYALKGKMNRTNISDFHRRRRHCRRLFCLIFL